MNDKDQMPTELRWGAGCLISATAVAGIVTLFTFVVLALDVPAWAQVLIGIAIVTAGGVFAWLVATALRGHRRD